MDGIKNCPCCGSDKVLPNGHYEDHKRVGYFVACWKCGLKTPVKDDKRLAVELWNRRAE